MIIPKEPGYIIAYAWRYSRVLMWSIIVFGSRNISLAKKPASSPIMTEDSTLVRVATYRSNVLAMFWLASGLLDREMRKAGISRLTMDTAPNSASRFSPKRALAKTPMTAQMRKI